VIIAVLDSCILYPAQIRDVLLSVASVGCFKPIWSKLIHEEWTRNVLKNRNEIRPETLQHTMKLSLIQTALDLKISYQN
jgi:hypothetical protein